MNRFQVKRMVVSTYQAASGAGAAAMRELELQTKEVSFLLYHSHCFLLYFFFRFPVEVM